MWKESNRNIVVIFQPNILRIVGLYVRHSAIVKERDFEAEKRFKKKSNLVIMSHGHFLPTRNRLKSTLSSLIQPSF